MIRASLVLALAAALCTPAFAEGPLCPARAPELFKLRPAAGASARAARSGSATVKPAAIAVGQQRTFWAWDFSVMPPGFRTVSATCRAVGERGLVYVEDSEWGTRFTEGDLAKISERFERNTPEGSLATQHGIGRVVADTFAPAPLGLDNDPRVVLLFTAMASFNNTSFDGYFNAFDTLPESEAVAQYQQHSNECEVLYLNTRGSGVSSEYMLGVIAHELAHLVSHQFDDGEVSWLDESLGEAAMVACGYPTDIKHLERFATKPETPLVTDGYVSYGACFLFGTYLLEQLGPQAIGQIVRDPGHGADGLEKTLAAANRGPFAAFHRDWAVANFMAHDGAVDARYRYRAFDVPALAVREASALPAEDAGELAPQRVRYLRIPKAPQNISMALEPSTAGAHLFVTDCCGAVRQLLTGTGSAQVDKIARVLVLVGSEKCGYRTTLTPRTSSF